MTEKKSQEEQKNNVISQSAISIRSVEEIKFKTQPLLQEQVELIENVQKDAKIDECVVSVVQETVQIPEQELGKQSEIQPMQLTEQQDQEAILQSKTVSQSPQEQNPQEATIPLETSKLVETSKQDEATSSSDNSIKIIRQITPAPRMTAAQSLREEQKIQFEKINKKKLAIEKAQRAFDKKDGIMTPPDDDADVSERTYDEDGNAFSLEDEGVMTANLDELSRDKILKMTRGELAKVHREIYKQFCKAQQAMNYRVKRDAKRAERAAEDAACGMSTSDGSKTDGSAPVSQDEIMIDESQSLTPSKSSKGTIEKARQQENVSINLFEKHKIGQLKKSSFVESKEGKLLNNKEKNRVQPKISQESVNSIEDKMKDSSFFTSTKKQTGNTGLQEKKDDSQPVAIIDETTKKDVAPVITDDLPEEPEITIWPCEEKKRPVVTAAQSILISKGRKFSKRLSTAVDLNKFLCSSTEEQMKKVEKNQYGISNIIIEKSDKVRQTTPTKSILLQKASTRKTRSPNKQKSSMLKMDKKVKEVVIKNSQEETKEGEETKDEENKEDEWKRKNCMGAKKWRSLKKQQDAQKHKVLEQIAKEKYLRGQSHEEDIPEDTQPKISLGKPTTTTEFLKHTERFGDKGGTEVQDGISLVGQVAKGLFPSVYYGKKTQDSHGMNWKLDEKSINEGRAWWTKSDVIRDAQMRRPNHPDYDKSTIFIPDDVWKSLSSSKIQYWRLKQKYYDKIFFFKVGKFYEIFYDDAVVCHRELDLYLMFSSRGSLHLHTSFQERKLGMFIARLTDKNYKVAIIEQTESTRQCMARNVENKLNLNGQKMCEMSMEEQLSLKAELVSNRQIKQIFSKGTYNNISKDSYESQYVLAITSCQNYDIGVCYFDISTFKCFIGTFKDSINFSLLRTVISQIRPVEIIYDKAQVDGEMQKMIKNNPVMPLVTQIQPEKVKTIQRSQNSIDKYLYNAEDEQKGESNRAHKWLFEVRWQEKYYAGILAFGLCVSYLEESLLAENSIKFFEYIEFNANSNMHESKYMIMDSQAIEHLEIAECIVNGKGTTEGSLLEFVDHTQTSFGKRQMRKWLLSPLLDPYQINDRLDAIEDLMRMPLQLDLFREQLAKLPDLEKILAKVFVYSVQTSQKAIHFEKVQFQKLREFKNLLAHFRNLLAIIAPLRMRKKTIRSERLKQLIHFDHESFVQMKEIDTSSPHEVEETFGLVPNLKEAIQELDYLVEWKNISDGAGGEESVPYPRKGLDPNFDSCNDIVIEYEEKIAQYIERIKKQVKINQKGDKKCLQMMGQIKYIHAKLKYEMEIPNELVTGDKKPDNLVLVSQRHGFQRFHTQELRNIYERYETKIEDMKDALQPFVCAIFARFYQNRHLWQPVVNIIAELDCLQSLSLASKKLEGKSGKMCRPIVLPDMNGQGEFIRKPMLKIINMQHPGLRLRDEKIKASNLKNRFSQRTAIKTFVPNSTELATEGEPGRAILLTGPNMGGKSTLLRQTCLAVVLAQVGCYVPAEKVIITPVDRIFTRLGASDRILEGKSTFFVEMEETKNILQFGSRRSLAILDELGRGTSTFDGYSIANSVLKYLVRRIKCRTLFATHYHMLIDDFRLFKHVACYHMACKEDSRSQGKINFLYKFTFGECPKSFGMNVAMMSGLDKKLVDYAIQLSDGLDDRIKKISDYCRQNIILQNSNSKSESLNSQNLIQQDKDENTIEIDKEQEEARSKATIIQIDSSEMDQIQK